MAWQQAQERQGVGWCPRETGAPEGLSLERATKDSTLKLSCDSQATLACSWGLKQVVARSSSEKHMQLNLMVDAHS